MASVALYDLLDREIDALLASPDASRSFADPALAEPAVLHQALVMHLLAREHAIDVGSHRGERFSPGYFLVMAPARST